MNSFFWENTFIFLQTQFVLTKVKMILSDNFLKILIRVYKISPTICGQLFTFSETSHQFEILDKKNVTNGYKVRSFICFLVSLEFLARAITLKVSDTENKFIVDTNVCLMMTFIGVAATEHYRIRGSFPTNFLSFFNGAISIEKKYMRGTYL